MQVPDRCSGDADTNGLEEVSLLEFFSTLELLGKQFSKLNFFGFRFHLIGSGVVGRFH